MSQRDPLFRAASWKRTRLMTRLTSLLAVAAITSAIAGMPRPSSAATLCRPYGEFGQTGVLGTDYGGALQCESDNSLLFSGTRSIQTGGAVLEPVDGLRYELSPWDNWTMRFKADIHEHIGGYEVNSLPEVSLAWTSPHQEGAVQFMLAAAWGSYSPTTTTVPIQRTEFSAAMTFPTWKIASAVDAQVSVTGGYAMYSTPDVQSWIETDVTTRGSLGSAVDWSLALGVRGASGTSPLEFDARTGDAQASPGLTFRLDSQSAVSVRGTWSFQSATMSGLYYEIRTTALGPAVTFGYDPQGQTLSGSFDAPKFGNIALRYDALNSAFFAVFQPH